LAGGAVRNTIWRSLFGNDRQLVINDFDIAFFDALGDRMVWMYLFNGIIRPTPAHIHIEINRDDIIVHQ
jgi:hypothetical protein